MKRFAGCAVVLAACLLFAAGETAAAQEAAPLTAGQDAAPTQTAGTETQGAASPGAEQDVAVDTAAVAGAESATDGTATAAPVEPEPAVLTRDEQILELDIKTSTLAELAAWCRSLGISEGGTRDDLANRLRSHFKLPAAGGTVSETQRTITIESARTTEYFTLDVVDEEYARLRGDVVISLKDGNALHRITAWEILYNRTRNLMTASGGVVYIKEESGTTETFRGESITVNLDNWASIFLDGMSEHAMSGGGTAYRFSGTVISRNSEEVTVLTDAEITNAQNKEALWSLNASKVWLLPGSDWAILNAVLKVGNIPVLWLPFFYYPQDEIVFHPVLGTRSREGTFLQTTTYLLGRPKSSTAVENSITKIFGSAPEGDVVREGLFLRATGEKTVSADGPRLSVLFDAYANLGFYFGTELYLPRKDNFNAFNLSLGLGFTRNIYQLGSVNSPFFINAGRSEGTSVWNDSYLFAFKVPFRYRMEMTGSVSIGQGSLSWNIPFYSDPYVRRDFMDRSESLDWLAMLREGASANAEDNTTTTTYISTYEMRLNGSFTPRINLAPYINSLSVSGISSSLLFSSQLTSPYSQRQSSPENPDRRFFYPNKFIILSATASMSGTPLTLGQQVQAAPLAASAETDSYLPAVPVSPWLAEEEVRQAARPAEDPNSLVPPVLGQRFDVSVPGGPQVTLNYTLGPSAASELQFNNSGWQKAEDIDWTDVSSLLTRVRSDASLGLTINHASGNAYSGSLRLTGTGGWQDYSNLDDSVPATQTEQSRLRAYNETFVTSSYNLSATVRPLYLNSMWSNTSLTYDVGGLLAKTVFDQTNYDTTHNPVWNWEFGEWSKEKLDTHSVSARLEASVMDKSQSLTIQAVLPPRDAQLSGNALFNIGISETRVRGTLIEPFDNEKRIIQPIYFTETLRFTDWLSFEQYLTWDPEVSELTSLTSSLRIWQFSARYQMSFLAPYRLNYNQALDPTKPAGWIQYGDKAFQPQELGVSFSHSRAKSALWPNGPLVSFNVSSALTFDLQRYTYSRLTFSLTFGLEISQFLTLQFSTSSENAQMYRFLRNLPLFPENVPLAAGIETNFFVDLFNSFRFDDESLRRKSAFKLKSFSLNAVHYLGDWTATLGITLAPYLSRTTSPPTWKFNNTISFTIKWTPIEEIHTEIRMGKNTTTDIDEITFK